MSIKPDKWIKQLSSEKAFRVLIGESLHESLISFAPHRSVIASDSSNKEASGMWPTLTKTGTGEFI